MTKTTTNETKTKKTPGALIGNKWLDAFSDLTIDETEVEKMDAVGLGDTHVSAHALKPFEEALQVAYFAQGTAGDGLPQILRGRVKAENMPDLDNALGIGIERFKLPGLLAV